MPFSESESHAFSDLISTLISGTLSRAIGDSHSPSRTPSLLTSPYPVPTIRDVSECSSSRLSLAHSPLQATHVSAYYSSPRVPPRPSFGLVTFSTSSRAEARYVSSWSPKLTSAQESNNTSSELNFGTYTVHRERPQQEPQARATGQSPLNRIQRSTPPAPNSATSAHSASETEVDLSPGRLSRSSSGSPRPATFPHRLKPHSSFLHTRPHLSKPPW